jgi:hypothetical protein
MAMQEGKRQKQVGGLIQEELNKIFQRLGLNMIDGGNGFYFVCKSYSRLIRSKNLPKFFPGG